MVSKEKEQQMQGLARRKRKAVAACEQLEVPGTAEKVSAVEAAFIEYGRASSAREAAKETLVEADKKAVRSEKGLLGMIVAFLGALGEAVADLPNISLVEVISKAETVLAMFGDRPEAALFVSGLRTSLAAAKAAREERDRAREVFDDADAREDSALYTVRDAVQSAENHVKKHTKRGSPLRKMVTPNAGTHPRTEDVQPKPKATEPAVLVPAPGAANDEESTPTPARVPG